MAPSLYNEYCIAKKMESTVGCWIICRNKVGLRVHWQIIFNLAVKKMPMILPKCRPPTHPGEMLLEKLDEYRMDVTILTSTCGATNTQ